MHTIAKKTCGIIGTASTAAAGSIMLATGASADVPITGAAGPQAHAVETLVNAVPDDVIAGVPDQVLDTVVPQPALIDCAGGLDISPASITLTCADANTVVTDITWDQDFGDNAVGHGTLHTNTCDPVCADGQQVTRPVGVTLHDHDRGVFTVATVGGDTVPFEDYQLGTW